MARLNAGYTMLNKKFKVIEEGRLSNQMLSKIKGGDDIAALGKCNVQEPYLSCTCPKLVAPGDDPFGNCAILCSGQYILKPCNNKFVCSDGYKFCPNGNYKTNPPILGDYI